MLYFTLAALAIALVVATLALIRETRLRRALQKLLRALFHHRRTDDSKHDP